MYGHSPVVGCMGSHSAVAVAALPAVLLLLLLLFLLLLLLSFPASLRRFWFCHHVKGLRAKQRFGF